MRTLKDILNNPNTNKRLGEILKYKSCGDYVRSCFGAVINPAIFDLGNEDYTRLLKSERNIELAQWDNGCTGWVSLRLSGHKRNQDFILRCDSCYRKYEELYNAIYDFRVACKKNPKVTFDKNRVEVEELNAENKPQISNKNLGICENFYSKHGFYWEETAKNKQNN